MKEKIIEILRAYHMPFIDGVSVTEFDAVADDVISLFSQPNGGDRVVSENEKQEKKCDNCGGELYYDYMYSYYVCKECFQVD